MDENIYNPEENIPDESTVMPSDAPVEQPEQIRPGAIQPETVQTETIQPEGKKPKKKKKERRNDSPIFGGFLTLGLYFIISFLVAVGFQYVPAGPVKDFSQEAVGIIWPIILVLILGCGSIFKAGPRSFGKTLLISLPMILIGAGTLLYKIGDTMSDEVSLQSSSVIALGILSLVRAAIAETTVFIGAVSRRIGERYGRDQEGVWYSAVMSGVIFAVLHLIDMQEFNDSALISVAACLFLGILYAGIYYRSMNIYAIILLHLICYSTTCLNTFIHRASALSYIGGLTDTTMLIPAAAAFIYVCIVLRRKKIREAVENLCGSEAAALLPPDVITKEEKRRLDREREQRRIDRLKEQYADAPLAFRVFRIYMLKPLVLICLIAAGSLVVYETVLSLILSDDGYEKWAADAYQTAAREDIETLSPIDTEGAARINAIPGGSASDTWTICLYLIGSDLEDLGENDLSDFIRVSIYDEKEDIAKKSRNDIISRSKRFSDELDKKGVDLPAYLSDPVKPVAYEINLTESVTATDRKGAAASDLDEIVSGDWGDNVNIIVQTGGTRRWSKNDINPNRTQRFLIKHGKMEKIDDISIRNMASPDTLAEFMQYCNENYPADHNMLVFWDHGGGSFGYGMDRIYGSMLSLADIRTALSKVYTPDRQNPAFDVIGFDACLMANLDVVHYLDGYASYLAVSEESEPNQGWNYAPWLQALSEDPSMSPARLSMTVADAYMDYYMTMNLADNIYTSVLGSTDVTFSVLDENKGCELYDAYCELARTQLADSAGNMSVLTDIGRCGNKSTHYASDAASVFNLVDLGGYVDHLIDTYPEQSSKIKDLIHETVLYHRENGYLSDSQGISVFLPCSVDSYSGFSYALEYIYDICEDENIRALYYYKTAGCLNDDMLTHMGTLTDKTPSIIHLAPFERFSKTDPVIDEEGFSIPLSDELSDMIVSYYTENAIYDPSSGKLIELGFDETASLNGEGDLLCDFDGTWIFLDGVPLSTEIQSSSASSVEYRAEVLCDMMPAYLVFSYDRDSEVYTINGVTAASDDENPNLFVNTKTLKEVTAGTVIQPIYAVTDMDTGETVKETGNNVTFSANSAITRSCLENGYYVSSAIISDLRGDIYSSKVVGSTVSHGQVSDRKIDPEITNDH